MSYSQCYGVISRSAHFPPSPLQPRQDAARSPLLVQRQPPSPAGGQLGPDPGELPLQVTRRQEAVGPGTQSPGPRQATTRGTGPWRWPATRTARPTTSPTHSQGPAWTGSGRSTGGHTATHGAGKIVRKDTTLIWAKSQKGDFCVCCFSDLFLVSFLLPTSQLQRVRRRGSLELRR